MLTRRSFLASALGAMSLGNSCSSKKAEPPFSGKQAPTSYSIEQALDAMVGNDGKHELPLIGEPPQTTRYKGSFVAQGGQPNSGSVPDWGPKGHTGKKEELWPEMVPFYVLYDAQGHGVNLNAGVYMSPVEALYLSKRTGQWVQIQLTRFSVHWVDKMILPYDKTAEGEFGSWSKHQGPGVLLGFDANPDYGSGRGLVGHGWASRAGPKRKYSFDASDCCGLRIRCAAWLALRNSAGIDDRDKAKYLLSVGADYYPPNSRIKWNPAAGSSRGVLITNEPKMIEFNSIEGAFEVDKSGRDIEPNCHTKTVLKWIKTAPSLDFLY